MGDLGGIQETWVTLGQSRDMGDLGGISLIILGVLYVPVYKYDILFLPMANTLTKISVLETLTNRPTVIKKYADLLFSVKEI